MHNNKQIELQAEIKRTQKNHEENAVFELRTD